MTFPNRRPYWTVAVGIASAIAVVAIAVVALSPRAPTPIPTPAIGRDPAQVAFLDRPSSGPIHMSGCRDVLIEDHSFVDLGADVEAIRLEGCQRVTIRMNDFARVAQAITVIDSVDVRIEWNRYEDILGPHARVGRNRANFVQFDRVAGGYIGHNIGRGGDTEDIISIHASHGTAEDPLIIEHNHFEGTTWTSGSGSGIALGDGGSSHAIARDNVLLNPGQVGIFIAGGTDNAILDNVVYGEQRTSSNVGIYVWNQSDGPCAAHEVSRNQVAWRRADGESNPGWDHGGCGSVTGWNATNDWAAILDPERLRVDLGSGSRAGSLKSSDPEP